ncbi:ABC transporter ATP-binding protein [Enterococcus ureilyticus]|uniref:ABC transporter ATP-binding protein n=1 Tax=Enterococcus ureilyticus TaxID=1131292 RepID=A0A1E5HFG9_9ENTE|nr:ATP-binding cassette domain-containing protein [Enterococcus ureilyticus]MBM7689450.1 ABC-type lipoprotein export system ATPase subunit [Enterococcus ureilyticus]OEG23697.1 ABC transporter ATP-binding protein [Enterococcus ureilyticus]
MTILSLKNIVYTHKKNQLTVLEDVTINFSMGKVYGILGKSGVGKTTLLALLAGISTVDSGSILFKEQNLELIDRNQYRQKEIGTIFQQYNVLSQVSALRFLKLCAISSAKQSYDDCYFYELLKKVGLDKKLANQPIQKLSVSNQQRVYLAKAVVNDPQIILLDDPTKSLSELSLAMVMSYLRIYAKNEKKCIIVSSESKEIADYVDELWGLNGRKLSFIKDVLEN